MTRPSSQDLRGHAQSRTSEKQEMFGGQFRLQEVDSAIENLENFTSRTEGNTDNLLLFLPNSVRHFDRLSTGFLSVRDDKSGIDFLDVNRHFQVF